MGRHPVPQNISGFQFKLIGDMTIRQFLYLAGGILSGYIILRLGIPSLIKWFLAASLAGAGFAFAFIPIEERPLDRWLVSFFKSIYSPTQFLWKKRPVPPEILTAEVSVSLAPTPETLKKGETAAKIEEYLLTLPTAPVGELEQKEESFVNQVTSIFAWQKPGPPAVAPPLIQKTEKPQEMAIKPTVTAQVTEEPRVKIVTPTIAPKIGLPHPPTIPNTPSGIVKTRKGAILPGILVEIRNQEGTPVRALKTGKLGQFAVSTPLANGAYTLHLEDSQKTFYFDIIEVTLTGEIVSPLEIFAKTQKDKEKEELKKKLFNQDSF